MKRESQVAVSQSQEGANNSITRINSSNGSLVSTTGHLLNPFTNHSSTPDHVISVQTIAVTNPTVSLSASSVVGNPPCHSIPASTSSNTGQQSNQNVRDMDIQHVILNFSSLFAFIYSMFRSLIIFISSIVIFSKYSLIQNVSSSPGPMAFRKL